MSGSIADFNSEQLEGKNTLLQKLTLSLSQPQKLAPKVKIVQDHIRKARTSDLANIGTLDTPRTLKRVN